MTLFVPCHCYQLCNSFYSFCKTTNDVQEWPLACHSMCTSPKALIGAEVMYNQLKKKQQINAPIEPRYPRWFGGIPRNACVYISLTAAFTPLEVSTTLRMAWFLRTKNSYNLQRNLFPLSLPMGESGVKVAQSSISPARSTHREMNRLNTGSVHNVPTETFSKRLASPFEQGE